MATREATGDCFDAAFKHLLRLSIFDPDYAADCYLVHAPVWGQGHLDGVRFGHGWVEHWAGGCDSNRSPDALPDMLRATCHDRTNGRELDLPAVLYYTAAQLAWDDPYVRRYRWYEAEFLAQYKEHTGPWGYLGVDL